MYFIKFSHNNASSGKKEMTYKEFENKGEALRWLFANGYEADCIPHGASPYNANIFWNAEEKVSVMGWNC